MDLSPLKYSSSLLQEFPEVLLPFYNTTTMATKNIDTHRDRDNGRLYLELVMLLNLPINKKPNQILIIVNTEY